MENSTVLKKVKGMILPVSIILIAALMRLLPHAPNFTPISAMALFGGVYLSKRYALLLPVAAMFFSDLFLGFHTTMLYVYGSFLMTVIIGMLIQKRQSVALISCGALLSSVLFFLITNFGVWFTGTMYPKTLSGLFQAYYMGIPFFRNTIAGDLFYTLVFFGGYAVFGKVLKRYPAPKRI